MIRDTINGGRTDPASVFDRRILRRVRVEEGPTGQGDAAQPQNVACVVDVETTGFSLEEDGIIEFAARRVHFDDDGVITHIERASVWREDPGRPIPPEITRLTGLTDDHVAGQRIDEDEVLENLAGSDIVVAHFAQFDKPFLTKRIAPIGGMLWGCSCVDVDWSRAGYDGRALGWLCSQAGWFFDGHRALDDVDAVVTLLRSQKPDGEPILAELVRGARQVHLLVEAVGAAYRRKDALRLRGYRWNARKRVWAKPVSETSCLSEEAWLARHVYASGCGARAMGPLVSEISNAERFM